MVSLSKSTQLNQLRPKHIVINYFLIKQLCPKFRVLQKVRTFERIKNTCLTQKKFSKGSIIKDEGIFLWVNPPNPILMKRDSYDIPIISFTFGLLTNCWYFLLSTLIRIHIWNICILNIKYLTELSQHKVYKFCVWCWQLQVLNNKSPINSVFILEFQSLVQSWISKFHYVQLRNFESNYL
jgi:hypothetical protein